MAGVLVVAIFVFLVPRVFSLKRFTAGNFTVTCRVSNQKNLTGDNVLF